MAGHLAIPTKTIHTMWVSSFLSVIENDFNKVEYFKEIPKIGGGHFKRLTSDYFMNEEHGKVDFEVFSYTPIFGQCSYEIHLNSHKRINQVYLVM